MPHLPRRLSAPTTLSSRPDPELAEGAVERPAALPIPPPMLTPPFRQQQPNQSHPPTVQDLMRHTATLLVLLVSTTALAAPPTSALGDWKTTSDSIVRVAPCGPNVCLMIVKPSPTATETSDQNNPDATLRKRSLCGLVIGTGFHQTDPNHLSDGHLYDPKTGHTYSGTIAAEGDTLHLYGYIGISLFGRSETWHRVPTVPACH